MGRRFAPNICFLLLWVAFAKGNNPTLTGGQGKQLRYKRDLLNSEEITESENAKTVKRSLTEEGGRSLKSGEHNAELLKTFSRDLPRKNSHKREVKDFEHDTLAARDSIAGDLYPEIAIHNLEQTSDKVESDMLERKSKIPTRITRAVSTPTQETLVSDKAVYNIGQDVSLEVPLTTHTDERGTRVEELTKRDTVPQEDEMGSKLTGEDNAGSIVKREDTSGTLKRNSTRRDEVPISDANFHDSLDDASDNDFRIRDKSADLEIHADSTGVRVKAKPASLQVVSNPHGNMKTLPGETHSEGVIAERRTFTPVLPADKRAPHHHHHVFQGLIPRSFPHLPFLRHRHHFRHHHRLPWLRHRQHINYPDVFERMRYQNSMMNGEPSPFGMSPGMGPPLAGAPPMEAMMNSPLPMTSMMNSPSPMLSGNGAGMGMIGGGGMSGPLIPQLLQRSPTMESNPSNRFGVPESPMGEMSPMGDMSPGGTSPMGEMPSMGRMSPMGDMSPGGASPMGEMPSMGRMSPMGDMSPMERMGPMGDMSPMNRMGPMEDMSPMSRMGPMPGMFPIPGMSSMSPSTPFGQGEMRRKNALEFWGMPNRDQLTALARGENVQKVLGTNRYGESLGGITGNGMNFHGGMNPGMGGPSFNANGMGGMMGRFGGTSNAMFHGMSGGMFGGGMRRGALYKKDDINKTDEYKKSMALKKSLHGKTKPTGKATSGGTKSTHEEEKFEKGIMIKAQGLVAGKKHIAKNEQTTLHREHRIRKSSKLAHDEEKRSLPQDKHSKKNSIHQKSKAVRGSKKDVTVQRPPIVYHPAPEVYHRPDIILHRAPVLFQRPPIVYHQAPVVIHRPAVVYRQPPIVFHQPHPMVHQPYFRALDNFVTSPAYTHVGSQMAQSYNYMGTPFQATGYRKGTVPGKPGAAGKKSEKAKAEEETKRAEIPNEKKKSNVDESDQVAQKKKKDVVVNRPPIIYHPPPEVYHRPEIVVHRAPLLIRRPPIVYHQPAVIVHRPPVVYHQPPIVFHQPAPTVNQPVLYSHDNFVVHPSFFATHHGSVVSDAGQMLGIPNTVSVPDTGGYPFQPMGMNPGGIPVGGMSPMVPMGRRKRSVKHKKLLKHKKSKHVKGERKNAVLVKRPPIVYHPPPEVYHRPDIVVHRAPLIIHRSPVVYHQPPVVVHRPAVVYHQPPVMFHQPTPMVSQPTYVANDVLTPQRTLSLVGSTSPTPVASAVALMPQHHTVALAPPAVAAPSPVALVPQQQTVNLGTSAVPATSGITLVPVQKSFLPKKKSTSEKDSKKTEIKKNHKSKNAASKEKHESSEESKRYSIAHHIEETFSESDVEKLAGFFTQDSLESVIAAEVLSIIKDRKKDENDIKPIVSDGVLKTLTVEQLGVIEEFLNKNEVDVSKIRHFLRNPKISKLQVKQLGKNLNDFIERSKRSQKEANGSKKGDILKASGSEKAAKKNAVLVKRPPIVYHPPPEVYHRPDIVVHRAPLVIHRAPIVYHQPPVIVHRPAVVYHQPPVLFHQPPPVVSQPVVTAHDVYHETTSLAHSGSELVPQSTYVGVPPGILGTATAFGKSKVPRHKKHSKRTRRAIATKDKTEKASKRNSVVVKRPPIIYHPPPEVYHRPDIVVHRAPIVIHRAPLVYHQPPVIVHRPAVVYHQPAVVFHQPPPMVHQPMLTSHDTYTTHNSLVLGDTSTTKVGDYEGPPPETFATRKGDVPKHKDVKGTSRNTIPKESRDKQEHSVQKSTKATKDREEHPSKQGDHPHRRSHLRKVILSLQKDHSARKSSGLQVAGDSPLVLQRPPLFLSRPAVMAPSLTGHSLMAPSLGHSLGAPMVQPIVQRVLQPVPVYQSVVKPVPVPVLRPVPVPVVYHHHHWPMHFHHHQLQPVVIAPHALPVPHPVAVPHYTTYSYNGPQYNPYAFGKSEVPKSAEHHKKDTIHIHDFGVPAHGHVVHANGNSHVVKHHGYITRHSGCPSHCGKCYPNCPSDCKPHCVAIIHHQHHRPHHVFVDHQHHHNVAQTHFHNHHWPVHHHNVDHGYPYHPHRHIGYPHYNHHYSPYYHQHGRRAADKDGEGKAIVPHYKVYQHVKHWHPPCIHHSQMCHHHHHPMTVYHDHHHPTSVLHHHHYHPYPVYHHHEHIKPVIYHHIKPYPVHHHHDHHIHDTWHHDHHYHHVQQPRPYPVPVPVKVAHCNEIATPVSYPYIIPQCQPVSYPYGSHSIIGRSHVPHKETKKSETAKPEQKSKNKKKDVVVNRPPIIYHPPPEVYHRPEIVVHRAPVLIHRPPIIYHQSSVIVHRPPVVYHQPPIVFHQPAPTVNQPVLYSHDNFVVHPSMLATHAGTMVQSAGHFVGVPSGPITNFPGSLPYGNTPGVGMAPYATPFGRKRRSTKESSGKAGKKNSKKGDKKNSIVVHRPPVIYHPPPEIYHRPRVVVHRPDVLIHRPPVVYHQSPVVIHRPPVVYHQTPIVFHQPPPMVNQPVYHSHDSYAPHPIFTHYNSDMHHVGAYQGVPHFSEGFHGFGGGFHGMHGGFGGYPGIHGGFDGFPGMHGGGYHGGYGGFGGLGGFHGGLGGFGHGFGRSKIEKPKQKKGQDKKNKTTEKSSNKKTTEKSSKKKTEKAHRKHSVMIHRAPIVFHPAPEVYHRAPYVIHQPDVVIHRPSVVYHQSPVVVHHPPIAYHQPPVVFHQQHPIVVQPTYHHHQYWQECTHSGHGCFGGDGMFGGFGHGGFGGGFGHGGGFHGVGDFHGGYPFLYGKSKVPRHKHVKKRGKTSKHHTKSHKGSKRHHKTVKDIKGSKKNDIIIHRPPLVYHPPPEIYHRPDVVVHRPDVLVHRPSVVYDQPAVVLHRPAVIYHEPPVIFHQPLPMVNRPVFHASDLYAPRPVYTTAGSHVDYDHSVESVPPHFSYGPYGVSHAYGKSKIESASTKENMEENSKNENMEADSENKKDENHSTKEKISKHSAKKDDAEKSTITENSHKMNHHTSHNAKKSKTSNAHKKYHLLMHRPPIVYHPSPTIYHRPDVVVDQPDIVIHRPSVVVQPSSVVVHKPAVVYNQPPVVFHQPEPEIHQPLYHSHDAYVAHPEYTHVGSNFEHGGDYLQHLDLGLTPFGYDNHHGDYHNDMHGDFGPHRYGEGTQFQGFGKSNIEESEKDLKAEGKHEKEQANTKKTEHDNPKHGKENHAKEHDNTEEKEHDELKQEHKSRHNKEEHPKSKRETQSVNTKRVQLPHAQKEKTETGTKKNAIVVRRPPIIYHPPPEVYHRPDIVVHRAPIVIQRAPLVYHQSPVIVHRPAVVYHQPAVVFHQPAPTVHQPIYHSQDTFTVHPHLSFTQAGSAVHQVGEYLGVPQEVMHRSNIEHTHQHPKQRRSTLEQHITPITPLNYVHPSQPTFEAPRSTIPYPTLNALHPYSLSYASFPWGYSHRTKRSAGYPYSHSDFATQVPHELFPLPYSPFYHPTTLQRPHVNVNIETVKSHVPKGEHRERRQSSFYPSAETPMMQPDMAHTDAMHYGHMAPYPALPRPHVNVNVETMKSTVPRSRRQIISGLQTENTQPGLATVPQIPQTYTQVPVAPVAPVPMTVPSPPDPSLGVYRDLLGAIYPRGVRRRPKVNIVVQTARSNIPTLQNVKRTVVPNSLGRENVDAFKTMPEVTTIEPPLLRDGVRVNMIDLNDPTAEPSASPPANFAPRLPTYNNMNMQNFGQSSALGLRGQGEFGMDKWKKSTISKPSSSWRDVNADKKSAVPVVHRENDAKKRYTIGGFQSPAQSSAYQGGLETPPTSYTAEPQSYESPPNSVIEQGQAMAANYANQQGGNQMNGILQPGRPHINVNVETVKKQTVGSSDLPSKRQLIGALPLTSLFRPNPNTAKASLKSIVPNKNARPANHPQPVTKRQQIMRRVPLAQAIPTLRHRVATVRGSRARPSFGYSSFPVQDRQPFHSPRAFSFQGVQPAPPQSLTPPPTERYVQPSVTQPPTITSAPTAPYTQPEIYPWGRRPHININIQTTKSTVPSKKIITPRFKREFPVLYHIIKAKAKSDRSKRDVKTRRDKRQIPMFPGGGFLQSLIPDPDELVKRAFYGSVPRYPINPAVLFPRARRPRPASAEKLPVGAIEVGGNNGESTLSNAASLLKNEFSQSFDDIAKIQRQEVNAIRGMNMANQPSSPPVVSLPQQASPGAQVVSVPEQRPQQPALMAAPANAGASAVPLQEQAQQAQPEVVPFSPQQSMASFAPAFQAAAAGQAVPAPQAVPAGQAMPAQFAPRAPEEIAPGFVRGYPEAAVQVPQPALPAPQPFLLAEPPVQVPGSEALPSKNPFVVMPPPGLSPQLPSPVMQFPFLPPAELPRALPFAHSLNPIPRPDVDDSDRPSVNIQVQTSKSSIPKEKKKVKTKDSKKKTH